MAFVNLGKRSIRLSEGDAAVAKHVAVLTVYKLLLIYIYIYTLGVTEGKDQTSGECSLGQTIPI